MNANEHLKILSYISLQYPLLSPSKLGEELYLYLAVTPHAASLALAREEGKIQRLVYYTRKALQGVEG